MPGDLPLVRTSFVGRGGLLARLESRIADAAVVTVVGSGGVGKTRLAVETARRLVPRFADGVRFVDLSAVRSGAAVAAEVAVALGVTPGSGDPVRLLVEQLGDRRVLLVLDNCEHLVDAVAELVYRVGGAGANVRVVCTSREPLAVGAEMVVPVPPLETPADAVGLFVDRALAADPAFVASDPGLIEAICDRLDRVPLAIELAAPWIRLFTPVELLARLSRRFDVLAATRRDLPARQRSMRATVEWSHDLLPEPERLLYRRLAVFAGTFDLAAAERVCGFDPLRPERVMTLLGGLNERSMLVVERSAGDPSRYRLLETMRVFAQERRDAADEAPELCRRHLAHFLAEAERVDTRRRRAGADAEVAALVPNGDNYRAALVWGLDHDPPAALRLAAALEGLWMIRSVAEGRGWLQDTLERAPEPTPHRARALTVAPLVVAGGLPWAQARALVQESIGISDAIGDRPGAAMGLLTMALSAFFHGELDVARACVEDARARYGDLDLPIFHARAAAYLGAATSFTPRHLAEGRGLLEEGQRRCRAIGDGWGFGMASTLLGLADLRAGYDRSAGQHLRAVLRARMQGGVTATAVGGLGALAVTADPARAVMLLEAATAVRERMGVPSFPVPVGRELDRALATARRRVPGPVAQRCRDRARGLTTEEVIALALTEDAPVERRESDRLTLRQREIALLVADGLSNREIAERLHLSVRTVETHVNNILTGLGFRSRARLAGWVRDVGLTDTVT